MSKAILYYTCLSHLDLIENAVRANLNRIKNNMEVGCVSLNKPISFGNWNLVLEGKRSPEMMHRQILAGLERLQTDYVFLVESDVLYHSSHFSITPARDDTFYFNTNVWRVRYPDGHAVWTDNLRQVSGVCAHRKLLTEHYRKRVERIEREGKFDLRIGYEPGAHFPPRGIDNSLTAMWESEQPNLDIRHNKNITLSKWSPADFRNQKYARGWKETDASIEGWGQISGRLEEFLKERL